MTGPRMVVRGCLNSNAHWKGNRGEVQEMFDIPLLWLYNVHEVKAVLAKLFAGRNGLDRYTLFLALISILFFPYPYIWIIGAALLGYAVFRAFSKNIQKRRQELYRFEEINRKIAGFLARQIYRIILWFRKIGVKLKNYKTRLSQRKQYVFLKCPQCKKQLRLPRKKGRLQATCPLCKVEFIKKT